MKLLFMIPEFPTQTHIAWYRISAAIADMGHSVRMLSTRRPTSECPHPLLQTAARHTTYLWPASAKAGVFAARDMAFNPAVRDYVAKMKGGSRLRHWALVSSAHALVQKSKSWGAEHLFVHSCADAAHVAAMSRLLGGPKYSLRLGGDLDVYGQDHRLKMEHATVVVTAAPNLVGDVVNKVGIDASHVTWTWVGTDTSLFAPATNPAGVCSSMLRVITVARLNAAKGFQYMLPAISQLVSRGISLRYTIVGEGPFRSDIERRIRELHLERHVVLHGAASSEQIASLHRKSDVFVLPTSGVGEGTPAAVCEAMSSGLPIVATRVGGLESMVDVGRHGILVEPANAEALADAIEALFSNSENRVRMGRACRDFAVARFDVASVAGKIVDNIKALGGLKA